MYSMKMKRNFLMFFSLFIVFLFLFQPMTTQANEENSAGATGFTYSITFPDNQVNKELGYYKLSMKPGQQQQLTITLSNPGSEKVTIDIKTNGAKTNQNGVIEYGESTIEEDASLKFHFKDIIKGPESVELAPGETKNLDLKVQMPETKFDGVLVGGIQMMRAGQEEATSKKGGSQIINQYAYVVAIVLQETDTTIAPELSLNNVKAGQSNYRNAVFVNFSNIMATYLNHMTVEVQITEKGKDTVLYERKQTMMRMAPNSFIDFPVSMNGERMVAGKYVANILVTSNDKKWAWTKEFKITNEDANKFNERDVGLVQKKGLNWQLILLIVVGILLVISALFFTIHLLRKKKQLRKKSRGTNSKSKKPKN